jgi:hypothetical protein
LYRKQKRKTKTIMKSRVLLIAALISLSAGVNAVAKEEDPRNVRLAVVPVKGSEVFKVIYKSETVSRIKLNIFNSQSQLVFSEVISGFDGFIRPLNFAGLEAGEYTVELFDGVSKKVEKINYAPASKASAKKIVHVSKVNEAEGKFLVAVTDANQEEITIKIFDRNNNLLYTETKEVAGEFAQVYRVKDSAGVKFEISDAAGVTKSSRF